MEPFGLYLHQKLVFKGLVRFLNPLEGINHGMNLAKIKEKYFSNAKITPIPTFYGWKISMTLHIEDMNYSGLHMKFKKADSI